MQEDYEEVDLPYNADAEKASDDRSDHRVAVGLGAIAFATLIGGVIYSQILGGKTFEGVLVLIVIAGAVGYGVWSISKRHSKPIELEQERQAREWREQKERLAQTAPTAADEGSPKEADSPEPAKTDADGDEEKHVGLLETVSAEREILEEMPEFNDELIPRMYNGVMRPHIFPTLGWRILGVAAGLLLWVGYLLGDYYQTPLLPLYTAIVLLLLGAASVVPLAVSLTNLHRRHKAYRHEHPKAWILVPLFIVGGLALIGVILAMVHVDFHPLLVIVTWMWSIFLAMVQWCVQSLPHFIFALVLIMIPPMVARFAVWLANPIYMAHGELAKVTGFFRRTRGSMDLSEVTDVKDHQGQIPWLKRLKVPWGDAELENPGQNQAFSYISNLPIRHITHIREGVLWAKRNRPRR